MPQDICFILFWCRIFDGIYHGGVVGVDVIGPLIARDIDMLCGDGSYESCSHRCDSESLPS